MDLEPEPIALGRLGQYQTPDWAPLEALLPQDLCGAFMWMNDIVLDDGTLLQAYKHSDTRMYLWLDEGSRAYEHLGDDRYRRMRRTDAVSFVLNTNWVVHRPEILATVREALESVQAYDVADESTRILPASPAAVFRSVP